MNNEIKIFEGNKISSAWDAEKEEQYFSIVDVVGTLTDSKNAGAYWRKLKQRLKEKGSEVVTFFHGLKMLAAYGKMRGTDSWQDHGVKEGMEYAILTNEISKAWSGMTTREYKDFKGLKNQNLRDNMPTTELIHNMLAETATKDITESSNPQGLEENKKAAKRGGNVAKVARETLEKETGELVITPKNAIDFGQLISDVAKELPKKADEPEEEE